MILTIVRATDSTGEPRSDQFELPDMEQASISNALQYINRHLDGSVAYYLSCRRGMCVCCVVKVNGKTQTACVVPVADGMVIEPVLNDLLVRDTVVDLSLARNAQYELLAETVV
jgi:succinate dehydrogenase/fumarate reductase-like Fe-S protein